MMGSVQSDDYGDDVETASTSGPKEHNDIEEVDGALASSLDDDRFMHTSMEEDREIDEGRLINESINQGMGSFIPDIMFKNITKSYRTAKQIYGDSILRELTGYDSGFMEKNIKVSEFQREIKKRIEERIENLKKSGFIDYYGQITQKGFELASLSMYIDELDKLSAMGMVGTKYHDKESNYGDINKEIAQHTRPRYREIDFRRTIKRSIRRGHSQIMKDDFVTVSRKSRGEIHIILGVDASGSMKGDKISACKRAAIALAYKAITQKDKVGIIIFGSDIREAISPTNDIALLMDKIVRIQARKETDFSALIDASIGSFTSRYVTKHLILLSDAMPTVGDDPHKKTVDAIGRAREAGITTSIIGIQLNREGTKLAKEIASIGKGKFYVVNKLGDLDMLVLSDYNQL